METNVQTISNQSIDELMNEMEKDFQAPRQEAEPVITTEPVNPDQPANAAPKDTEDFYSQLDERFLKTNKLIPFNNEDGSDYIRPKTLEELGEIIEANREHWQKTSRYEQKEEVLADIFKETSPAFQFLAQNANRFGSIEEMIPLAQSAEIEQSLTDLDLEDENVQEYIVSSVLALQGYNEAGIEEEIKDLKERGKLAIKSESNFVVLQKHHAENTQRILDERAVIEAQQNEFWNNYYSSLNENLIQAKDLDGLVLNQEDKIRVANNLIPDENNNGLPIFSKIDNLIASGDTVRLSLISMLLEDKALFDSYYASKTHSQAGKASAKVLRTAVTSNSTQEDVVEKTQGDNRNKDISKSYGNFL